MSQRIASFLLASAPFWAGAAVAAEPLPKRANVTLQSPALVGATLLPAGTYRVELGTRPDTVKFLQGKRTVAEAPVKVGLERAHYAGNALHTRTESGQNRLHKIVFAPSGLALEFPAETASAGGDATAATSIDR